MSRYRKHKRYSYPKRFTKEEKIKWIFLAVVFSAAFLFYVLKGFLFNCILEWPLIFDVITCWKEQIDPAVKDTSEKTVNFMPSF